MKDYNFHGYTAKLRRAHETEGKGWIAQVDELPGTTTVGETAHDALKSLEAAIGMWVKIAKRNGEKLPIKNSERGAAKVARFKDKVRIKQLAEKEPGHIVEYVNDCVLVSKRLKGFRPTYIAKQVAENAEEVIEVLDKEFVAKGLLKKEFEFCCLDDDCGSQLFNYETIDNLPKYITCELCGEEYEKEDVLYAHAHPMRIYYRIIREE